MSRRRVDRPAANDEDAKCLSQQTFLLGEFRERAGYESPPVRTVVHGHHKAIFGMGSDEAVLAKVRARLRVTRRRPLRNRRRLRLR